MGKTFGFDRLREQLLDNVEAEFEACRNDPLGDSEIEKLLFYALTLHCRFGETQFGHVHHIDDEKGFKWLCDNCQEPTQWFFLRRQVQMEFGRVDFIVSVFDWNSGLRGEHPFDVLKGPERRWRHLVIECDGHNFHERTKEQAARDRSRDRNAMLAGMDFFRFTGSEIWRDPWGCASQVFEWAQQDKHQS